MGLIYKICGEEEWKNALIAGIYEGSADDRRDGFIHFSAANQVAGTLARHFSGRRDLVLIAVDESALGDGLKYEASRGGALFPHLYGVLPLTAVRWQKPIQLANGEHVLPTGIPA
ncbi:MAG: DUF952 domain-containing protein [Aestuariivirga sp.]